MPPGFFSSLKTAAASPYALVAYICLLAAWIYIGVAQQRLNRISKSIVQVPAKDRAALLAKEYNVLPRSGLSPEQWIRSRKHTLFFLAFLALVVAGVVLATVALTLHRDERAISPTFPLTVYVHGTGGPQDVVLRNSGRVVLELGLERRNEPIGDNGQAYFPAIPANFRGQEVTIWVNSQRFESSNLKFKLNTSSIYLPVLRKTAKIVGDVRSYEPLCISKAQVSVNGIKVPVDLDTGHFEMSIPGDKLPDDDLTLVARAPGCRTQTYRIVSGASLVEVSLEPIHQSAKE